MNRNWSNQKANPALKIKFDYSLGIEDKFKRIPVLESLAFGENKFLDYVCGDNLIWSKDTVP